MRIMFKCTYKTNIFLYSTIANFHRHHIRVHTNTHTQPCVVSLWFGSAFVKLLFVSYLFIGMSQYLCCEYNLNYDSSTSACLYKVNFLGSIELVFKLNWLLQRMLSVNQKCIFSSAHNYFTLPNFPCFRYNHMTVF